MTLRGGIFTAAPVRGLRPTRSGRLLYVERTQSGQRQPFAFAQGLHRHTDHGVDGFAGLDLRDVCVESDGFDKLRFVHGFVA